MYNSLVANGLLSTTCGSRAASCQYQVQGPPMKSPARKLSRPRFKTSRIATLIAIFLLAMIALFQSFDHEDQERRASAKATSASGAVERAYANHRSGVWVEGEGEVLRLLADDREGSRHQRFIVRVSANQTLLISHNIDLAPRVPVTPGDRLSFRGRYEWNQQGGIVHWTHADPKQRDRLESGGWLRFGADTFR